jgi:hypothetical protein
LDSITENGNCARDGGADCDLQCASNLYYYGDLSSDEVRDRINAALLKYMMLLDDVTNWYPQGQTPTVGIEEIDTGADGPDNLEITEAESRESSKAGPYIGLAAGVLALLLLAMLLVVRNRRNNADEEVSHLKLEDDGDETFVQELASDEGTPEREYQSRGVHVIGETDSIMSHWTGYTGRRTIEDSFESELGNGRLGHLRTDVHQCSSATCEVCEQKRQQGVNFIATGSYTQPVLLPRDASRDYSIEDSVSL